MSDFRARLFDAIRSRADKPAIAGSRSYRALWAAASAWAARLRKDGVRPGDRVAALAGARPEAIDAMVGVYIAGAIWVPINPRYQAAEIDHVVRDSGARVVLVEPALAERLDARVATIDLTQPPPSTSCEVEPCSDEDTAMLIYTSGTTGPSKGVALSLRAVVRGIDALTGAWRWDATDVLSLQLPLFHVHGLCIGVHGALLRGMTIVLHERFDPDTVVADIGERGATVFMGVPTMYRRLLEHLQANPAHGETLATARLFTAGSAALPAADLEAFERLTGHRILERYGMSECLITLSNPLHGERRAGSVGLPIPGVQIRVMSDDGREVGAGEAGELQVQTPGMMRGYYEQPEATAAAFDGPWLRTGDIVERSADGYVRIVGRSSVDIIKSGGFKIATREIEEVLATHPAVAEVAVVGADDPDWGERIVAAVVVVPGVAWNEAALLASLQAHCRTRLADYKRPRQLIVLAALPRNAMGKVLKAALRGYAPRDLR